MACCTPAARPWSCTARADCISLGMTKAGFGPPFSRLQGLGHFIPCWPKLPTWPRRKCLSDAVGQGWSAARVRRPWLQQQSLRRTLMDGGGHHWWAAAHPIRRLAYATAWPARSLQPQLRIGVPGGNTWRNISTRLALGFTTTGARAACSSGRSALLSE